MKKFFKKSWIAILALATTVVAACSSSKTTNKTENTQNNTPANNEVKPSESDTLATQRANVQARIDELRKVIKEREMSCVYGSPEVMKRYGAETQRMRNEADSLQNLLDNGYGANQGKKKELKARLDELEAIIKDREMSDVYGSPEVIEVYSADLQQLRREADEIRKQIDALEGNSSSKKSELENRIHEIETTLQQTTSACVYGSPEVMQKRSERINQLKHERDSLQNELDKLNNAEIGIGE